jgi:hypothetical protein
MLIANRPITTPQTAVATTPSLLTNGAFRSADVQANFVTAGGGSTVTAFVQTSLDGGNTWADVACFGFTTSSAVKVFNLSTTAAVTSPITPTNGGLTANTAISGVMGNMWRALISSTGTYAAGTNLRVDITPRGPFGGSAI